MRGMSPEHSGWEEPVGRRQFDALIALRTAARASAWGDDPAVRRLRRLVLARER